MLALTGPVPPTAGVVAVHPPGTLKLTKVVFAGTLSERLTVAPLLGPALFTVMVYVMFCPAETGSGVSVFVIERSAWGARVSVSVALLLAGLGSVTPTGAVTDAVLVKVPVALGLIVAATV